MTTLTGKTALITGGGAGIGKAIALALSRNGARVAVTDIRAEWARAVADEIEAAGGEAIALELDVVRKDDAEKTVSDVEKAWGRLDVWVNNAGVSSMGRFLDLTEQDWDTNMAINAKGAFLCSQAAVRRMLRQDPDEKSGLRGKIVNLASMASKRGNAPFLAHYVASKFAVLGLTQALAGELAPKGILVNAVCPGYVRTGMQQRELKWEAELRGVAEDEVEKLFISDTPLGRIETPEDVANVVVFLASDASNFITGEAINVNGGAFMD